MIGVQHVYGFDKNLSKGAPNSLAAFVQSLGELLYSCGQLPIGMSDIPSSIGASELLDA